MVLRVHGGIGALIGKRIKEEDLLLFALDEDVIDEEGVGPLDPTEEREKEGGGVRSVLEERYNKVFKIKAEVIRILELVCVGKEIGSLKDLLIAMFKVLDIIASHDVFFGEDAFELGLFLQIKLGKDLSALDHGALGDLEGCGVNLAVNTLVVEGGSKGEDLGEGGVVEKIFGEKG